MTPDELDLARAKDIADIHYPGWWKADSGFTDARRQKYIDLSRAIRLGDEARGLRVVPVADLANLVYLLKHAMMFRAYVEHARGPLSEPWATKVLRDGEAMLAASPFAPEKKE